MMDLKNIKQVFLIGIGGIGMSALARYFREMECKVSGYDRTATLLTSEMEKSGISIIFEDEVEQINKDVDLVVYTPAIGEENSIYKFFKNRDVPVYKRSEALEMILQDMKCIAVAGTHGKTTISTMVAHILRDSGFGCNAFLGGISVNYNTNYWSNERKLAVVEADEYDRSFLRLHPHKAILTAIDADHLDIYRTEQSLQVAFIDFTKRIEAGGLLIYKNNLVRKDDLLGDVKWSYSLSNDQSDAFARHISVVEGSYCFDVVLPGQKLINKMYLNIGGRHNIENAVAAVAMTFNLGIEPDVIRKSLAAFKGVKRRFEYLIDTRDQVYIDDYAHHPEELEMLLSSVKELYPDDLCTVIFQPHLYSRTRDLAKGFAKALRKADEVLLLPIYPAREQPIPGVDSQLIADLLEKEKAGVVTKETLLEALKRNKNKVVVTAGAGDIGIMTEEIKNCLENNKIKKGHVG